MGTRERRERSDRNDRILSGLFISALEKLDGGVEKNSKRIALSAVGGYGRGELAPGSDLDLLILHDTNLDEKSISEFVNSMLYPLWNEGKSVDYAVRTRSETKNAARNDLRVILGLLDLRHIAGSKELSDLTASDAKEMWRKEEKNFLPQLRKSLDERHERSGELAFLLEPDLKESRGGLRDITVVKALSLFEAVPIALDRISASEGILANVRDALHDITGKNRDQLSFEYQDKVAEKLKYEDADDLMLDVAKAARAVDYIMDFTWHRLENSSFKSFGRPQFLEKFTRLSDREKTEYLDDGIVVKNNEVVIEEFSDPAVGLRAAALAAQRGLPINIESCIQLSENFVQIPTPWSRNTLEDLVTLIGAGEGMISVFETLDQEGLIEKWIPEWGHLRFRPQRNVLHRHTVDRHSLETAVRAALLTREVRRPDLLLVGALFHDIGKGYGDKDHSDYGAELIYPLALRIGFNESDAEKLATLVKQHLTLSSIATRRDLDDPQTVASVWEVIPDVHTLEILHALSIADGEATGRAAWSDWKAKLVGQLVYKAIALHSGEKPLDTFEITEAQQKLIDEQLFDLQVREFEGNYEVEVISPDRIGLLSTIAGVLSISRFDVRSARTRSIGDMAIMRWIVALDVNASLPTAEELKTLISQSFDGEIDLADKIDQRIRAYRKYPGIPVPPPVVSALTDGATNATVLEVRMHDKPGILFAITRAVTRFGVNINGAIVSTLGAEALDTLYITDNSGAPLTPERALLLANQVETILVTTM
jgi:[protein-PII] uridylyltransferase